GMSLPFLYGKNKVKAARFETEALALDAEMRLTQRMGELTGLYKQAVVLGDFVDKYEKVIRDESNLQLLKKAFDGGQISFLTYLQEVHYFYLANNDYLDTRHQYQQALAKLSRYQ
ncbi:MAG: TolC family protein, partial [Duncaniella sp.]|nr:TolC family protein [Duncaniella sp.]